jgi:hypothetical protein
MDVRALGITAHLDDKGRLAFGAGTPSGVIALEETFVGGRWMRSEDGMPLFLVPQLVVRRLDGPLEEEPQDENR